MLALDIDVGHQVDEPFVSHLADRVDAAAHELACRPRRGDGYIASAAQVEVRPGLSGSQIWPRPAAPRSRAGAARWRPCRTLPRTGSTTRTSSDSSARPRPSTACL